MPDSRSTEPDQPATRSRRRPSLGTILGGTALFLALGGTSYAAVALPAKSVGSRQLKSSAVTSAKVKANAITSAKVKDGSLVLKDFKAGQLSGGGAGAAGPAGPKGDPGAKGDKGEKGDQGAVGPAGPLLDVLPSGRTLTGAFGIAGHKTAASDFVGEAALSYTFPLAAAPTARVVTAGPTAECPGTVANPSATPGNLCFYVNLNAGGSTLFVDSSPYGATYFVSGLGAGDDYEWNGTWAVTAP